MTAAKNFWQDRRVLVTGATGLVGSWTVRALLERGAHVVGLVRDGVPGSDLVQSGLVRRIDTVRGAVEDHQLLGRTLAEYEIQTVFHLAAQTIVGVAHGSPLSTFEANIQGTWCLLEAARRQAAPPQILVASSDKAYGDQGDRLCTEDTPLEGRHPYDASKACADILARTYSHTYGLPVCVTRCANFFGGGDLNWNRIVPGTIRAVLRGERSVIRSDGRSTRDYLYVKDGAAAYLHLAECMASRPEVTGQAFNFSAESRLSVLDIVRRIQRLMDCRLEPDVRGQARHEIRDLSLSAAKARRLLGWAPRYALDDALGETIAWYRDYFATSGLRRDGRHTPGLRHDARQAGDLRAAQRTNR
jgi:CDP-glucose 4,6-dehydratase